MCVEPIACYGILRFNHVCYDSRFKNHIQRKPGKKVKFIRQPQRTERTEHTVFHAFIFRSSLFALLVVDFLCYGFSQLTPSLSLSRMHLCVLCACTSDDLCMRVYLGEKRRSVHRHKPTCIYSSQKKIKPKNKHYEICYIKKKVPPMSRKKRMPLRTHAKKFSQTPGCNHWLRLLDTKRDCDFLWLMWTSNIQLRFFSFSACLPRCHTFMHATASADPSYKPTNDSKPSDYISQILES